MGKAPLMFEDIHTAPRRKLFTFLGVEWNATSYAWIEPVAFLILGVILGLVISPANTFVAKAIDGVIYAVLAYITYVCHTIGHILGGKSVGSPMRENLLTAFRQVNLYDDADVPSRVHLGRALGGPIFNLIIGFIALVIWVAVDHQYALFFAVMNLIFGFGSFFPIPSVDGEVIWRELLKR